MASTAGKLDIYNMALGFAGQRTIASPSENTPEAIQCELYWDRARRSALQDFPYNFALRRVRLAAKALPEAYAGEWRFCYGLPDSCLKLVGIYDGTRGDFSVSPYQIRNEGQEVIVLTDTDQAWADCTVDVQEIRLWSELFVMSMARKLACLIAIPLLKNNPQKLQELEQLYQLALPRSDGHDASEGRGKARADSWLTARGLW